MSTLETPDGVQLHVEDEGQGKPIVLIHPWCGSTRIWDPVAPPLSASRRVVRFDLRGCGSSQVKEGTLTFDFFAQDLKAVLEHLDIEDATLVGWSMGVGVVHHYLQRYDSDRVSAACLVDYPIALREKRDTADKVCHQLNKRRDDFLERFAQKIFLTPNPEMQKLLVSQMKRVTRYVACQMYRMMGEVASPPDETFDVPAMLIFPAEGWFPESLPDWRVRFPQHDMPEFAKSRHAAPLEQPQDFIEALLEFTEG